MARRARHFVWLGALALLAVGLCVRPGVAPASARASSVRASSVRASSVRASSVRASSVRASAASARASSVRASAASALLPLQFRYVSGNPENDGRYVYRDPTSTKAPRSATVFDSETARTITVSLPSPTCEGGHHEPVIGGGTLFWICGSNGDQQGWIYEIASRHLIDLSAAQLGACSLVTACNPAGAGSDWVNWDAEGVNGCPTCAPPGGYYDFHTGVERSYTKEPGWACSLKPGCLTPALSRTSLSFGDRPCAPLPDDTFTPAGHGWDTYEINDGTVLYAQRCGTHAPVKLSTQLARLVGAQYPLVAWISTGAIPRLEVYDLATQRSFSFAQREVAEDQAYSDGSALLGLQLYEGRYLATLPSSVLAMPASVKSGSGSRSISDLRDPRRSSAGAE